ncbi:hypothetical protein LJK88_50535 [Paenibacillus sp. P26]|nr:hypothetical protein LJK88_50535 [Paenibacillus sp. P26]UUZ91371.1 hypothetical protein LJK87_37850 [Paenibacillus sp. P25]
MRLWRIALLTSFPYADAKKFPAIVADNGEWKSSLKNRQKRFSRFSGRYGNWLA